MKPFASALSVLLAVLALAFAGHAQEDFLNPDQEPPRGASSPNGEEERNSDPVWLASGEFHLEVDDMRLAAVGQDFVFRRSYRSRGRLGGPMGNRWSHSYDIRLLQHHPAGGDYMLREPGGRTTVYGEYDFYHFSSPGSSSDLYVNYDTGSGAPVITWADNTTWEFHGIVSNNDPMSGRIKKIVDRNGTETLFTYHTSNGRLWKVEGSYYTVTFGYDSAGRVTTLTDDHGRTWTYAYYTDPLDPDGAVGDLKSVTTPPVVAITGEPGGPTSDD